MKFIKLGLVFAPKDVSPVWTSHCMAPAPVLLGHDVLRVFVGGWDSGGISRIFSVDVDPADPRRVLSVSGAPCLDLGMPGTFDDNGVFPGHAYVLGKKILLYYTGFELSTKVRYFNFGGLATSTDGTTFTRVSRAPVLDRSDEGLYVRAGQSVLFENGRYLSCYSAGSTWLDVAGKLRPTYDVYFQESDDPARWSGLGRRILCYDRATEHGLGRPQLIRIGEDYLIFYTRRIVEGMKYHLGCARSRDLLHWERIDEELGIQHSDSGFDSQMVYFPAVVRAGSRVYLFYSGNDFGREGMGCAALEGGAH